ncbi:inactive leucine-rich repeat receptor-like protein kinase IMK2 [Carex littledalei]|uniref:Inactive leucine-rich repeat receptor-like protein kinase IMK2 n=1 Tax=Carex littledalei TaxID=544730 RepID=A0A833VKC9_9POAL|nr:inactive leucine-rich repeat receptor-like protein kinase IMK2 [Carex littledalei]
MARVAVYNAADLYSTSWRGGAEDLYWNVNTGQDSMNEPQKPKRTQCIQPFLYTFIVSLYLATLALAQPPDGVIISQADYQGLEALKHELTDTHGVLRSWNGTGLGACSGEWYGIKCVKGKVISISLPWRGLGGSLTEKIGQLTSLRRLSLHDNFVTGAIPSSIGFLPDLRGLYLFNNRFSGSIPPSIGNCVNLQALDLSNNSLIGSIPSSIANSTRLYRLNLGFNNLSDEIPGSVFMSRSIVFLFLPNNSLSGSIPDSVATSSSLKEVTLANNRLNGNIPTAIGSLHEIETLDFSGNSLTGDLPSSLSNLSSLVVLNFERNQIETQIPESIDGLKNLSILSLKGNKFYGGIPDSIGNIPTLTRLDLSENSLNGSIPISLVNLTNLISFNVSNNNLSGQVPVLLAQKFNSSSFRGNIQLCGYMPSLPCPALSPSPVPSPFSPVLSQTNKKKLSTRDLILIITGCAIGLLLIFCCILLCCLIRKRNSNSVSPKSKQAATGAGRGEKPSPAPETESGGGDLGGKLVHFDGPLAFTADDLLCATAEIMGKSTYGTVYRATLEDGTQVAVKRLREKITKGPKEFEAEVAALGKIRHENLLALRAYYLGPKGEKLLVFDYLPKGSLAAFLHVRTPETSIDWPTRMNIAKGTARGLVYLHDSANSVHGNLTSTNILLDDSLSPKIADFGLPRLMSAAANSAALAAVVTNNGVDLPKWVASIVKEEWTNEVFDSELMREADADLTGDELLNTLKLALHCVDPTPVARPEARDVLRQLEEIRPEGGGGGVGEAGEAGEASTSNVGFQSKTFTAKSMFLSLC